MGLEPTTYSMASCRSSQLSYTRTIVKMEVMELEGVVQRLSVVGIVREEGILA